MGAPTFHKHDALVTLFKQLADSTTYSSYFSIGKTIRGQSITCFKWGNGVVPVLFLANLHGWEDAGGEILYLYAKWLASSDVKAKDIMNRNLTYMIPCVNMDSYERQNMDGWTTFGSVTSGAMGLDDPRLPTNAYGRRFCRYGVDLNRNFAHDWYWHGCGDYPNSYWGSIARSEPETKAVCSFLSAYRPKLVLDMHYGGGPALWPLDQNNSTLNTRIWDLYTQYSNSWGATGIRGIYDGKFGIYPGRGSSAGGTGGAIGDAHALINAQAWMLEVTGNGSGGAYSHTSSGTFARTQSDMQNVFYPKVKCILVAMSEVARTY